MTELLQPDEKQVLDAYRRVRDRKFGDLDVSVSKGKLVKIFEVVKNNILDYTLKEAEGK